MYKTSGLLYYTPDTNIRLHVYYASIKEKKKEYQYHMDPSKKVKAEYHQW